MKVGNEFVTPLLTEYKTRAGKTIDQIRYVSAIETRKPKIAIIAHGPEV